MERAGWRREWTGASVGGRERDVEVVMAKRMGAKRAKEIAGAWRCDGESKVWALLVETI